jgi:hypothetical protein
MASARRRCARQGGWGGRRGACSAQRAQRAAWAAGCRRRAPSRDLAARLRLGSIRQGSCPTPCVPPVSPTSTPYAPHLPPTSPPPGPAPPDHLHRAQHHLIQHHQRHRDRAHARRPRRALLGRRGRVHPRPHACRREAAAPHGVCARRRRGRARQPHLAADQVRRGGWEGMSGRPGAQPPLPLSRLPTGLQLLPRPTHQ